MGTVAVLTLESHKSGEWISKLVASLEKLKGDVEEVLLLSLESLLRDPHLTDDDLRRATILVNRVSDAAPSHLVKACLAVLYQAELLGIQIFNGPRAYALCSNKWCHHLVLDRAQLQSPPTIRVQTPIQTDISRQELTSLIKTHFESTAEKFLLKPNSGGFGNGIVQFDEAVILTTDFPIYEDGIGLIQQYVPPCNQKIYRVWFLAGRVHCAVTRNVSPNNSEAEFAQGCVSSCSRPPTQLDVIEQQQHQSRIEPFTPDQHVLDEIEQQLLPLIPDADAGSVEYLVNEGGQRLYFDINLLSTLPDKDIVDGVWYCDPWDELAVAIVHKVADAA